MNIQLSTKLKQSYPDIKIGILKVRGVQNKKESEKLEKKKRGIEEKLRATYKKASEIATIQTYNKFYEKFKKTYPVQFQVQTILDGEDIISDTAIVEAMFTAELKNMFLTAGHDLELLKGDLITNVTYGTEEYVSISGKKLQLKENDIATADGAGIVSSVLNGPDSRTKITEETKNCLFFSYFPYGETDETIQQHFKDIEDNIRVFSGVESTEKHIFSSKDMVVTPWEVAGEIDYEKLVKQFGVKRLDDKIKKRIEKHTGELHRFLRRDIFFAHMYFDKILEAKEKGQTVYMYTGLAPSGPVHFGHMIPWIFALWLQQKLDVHLIFQVPDEEKPMFKEKLSFDDAQKWLQENLLDIIAIGFDPEKTDIIIDTQHADMMYKTACQVASKTTASTVKALFGLKDSDNVGKYFYTCMQSVPAFLPSIIEGKRTLCFIPCAIDQDVHFRLTRDVAEKLGYPKPSTILCRFLPGLEGSGKLSSSGSNIALTDSPAVIKKKIMKYAFSGGRETVDEHRKHGGDPNVDIAYQWLTFFEEDDKKLEEIRKKYEKGEILSGELKQMLVDVLVPLVEAHQKRRKPADVKKFLIR